MKGVMHMYLYDELNIITEVPDCEYRSDEFVSSTFSHTGHKSWNEPKIKGRPYKLHRGVFVTLIFTPIELIMAWPLISLIGVIVLSVIKFLIMLTIVI